MATSASAAPDRLMRTLAIGDVHGCHTALVALLDQVKPALDDQFVFLGDYIDRGSASRAVVDYLIQFDKQHPSKFLRGNHEIMILEAREDPLKSNLWQSYGGLETAFSYGADFSDDWPSFIPSEHWEFFNRTARYYETDHNIFVHACLNPKLEMKDQPDWLLFWEYFEKMQPHQSGKRIICGHTPQKSGAIKNVGFALCIDTDASRGGWLTCLDVESGQFWQANERGDARGGAVV
jgi:serine/threonine protein phosphatase 1